MLVWRIFNLSETNCLTLISHLAMYRFKDELILFDMDERNETETVETEKRDLEASYEIEHEREKHEI